MDPGKFIFKSDDPDLQHITLSLQLRITTFETYEGKVQRIIDGDTLQVSLTRLSVVDTVRLLAIDAPETGSDSHAKQQCGYLGVDMNTLHTLAKIAGIHLQWLLTRGAAITLKTTGTSRDDRNRILAGVFVGDACINRLMVEHGYAIAYQGYSDWESYFDLETAAREAEKGIFGSCEETFYLASSKLYHRPGCNSAQRITLKYQTTSAAKEAGLSPCSSCLPDYRRA
jgi:endonuclease YncB( thermonuclease family)